MRSTVRCHLLVVQSDKSFCSPLAYFQPKGGEALSVYQVLNTIVPRGKENLSRLVELQSWTVMPTLQARQQPREKPEVRESLNHVIQIWFCRNGAILKRANTCPP